MGFFKDVAFDFINEPITLPNQMEIAIAKYMFTMMAKSKDVYLFEVTSIKDGRSHMDTIDIRNLNYHSADIIIPAHQRCRCCLHHFAYRFNKNNPLILYIQMFEEKNGDMLLVSNDLGSRQETNVLELNEEQVQLYYKVKLVAS